MLFVRWTDTDPTSGVRRERKGWVEHYTTNQHGQLVAVVLVEGAVREVDAARFTSVMDTKSGKRRRHLERWLREDLGDG